MLDVAVELQHRYENSIARDHRKRRGQVFTPPEVARFMASLFSSIPRRYRLLDAGAGLGILTAAFCERLLGLRSPRHLTVDLFENDQQLIPLLRKTLEHCRRVLADAGHTFDYIVHTEDFIHKASCGLDAQRTFDADAITVRFDGAIMNPPYFKVRKDSEHAKLMARIVHGQPNMYAFFMALGAQLLKESGELVAITPRSFCSGLYFRSFRRWYLARVALDHVHIFESRTETFKHSDVLQESVITKVHRLGNPSAHVTVTATLGRETDDCLKQAAVPVERIVDNSSGDCIIRIPESDTDGDIMQLVESLPSRFTDLGLRIWTGPVVLFRAAEFLVHDAGDTTAVPLLHPHNVKPYATVWPLAKNGKPVAFKLCNESLRLLVPTKNYVLLKRFTSKEERRRLTAGCLLRSKTTFSHVAIENHVNYVYHGERDLTEDETYGIAAWFNSTLLDRYFRTISGNTQVNATDIRAMNFPDLSMLGRIGRQAKRGSSETEAIILHELGVNVSLCRCLVGS